MNHEDVFYVESSLSRTIILTPELIVVSNLLNYVVYCEQCIIFLNIKITILFT